MRRPRSTFLVLWLVLAATAARADDLDDYLKARMTAAHLPGMSFAIVDDGKVARIGALGVSDVERATPATAETVYKIGSVSKQFIATAIMLLVQDGRLTVDDPVSRYLDGTPPEWQPITIRQLLTHTAGLVRESPAFAPMESKPDTEIVKAAYSSPLRFTPGSSWAYSNVGYYALAEIVTRVSGRPWPLFLQERVFTPAGMTATAPTNVAPTPSSRALGYSGKDNERLALDWVALRPSGAFLSTVGDLARWDIVLSGERVLSAASRREMWAPVRLNDGTTYAYGFGWHTGTAGGRSAVWHGGSLPGFQAFFGRFVDDKVTVIVLVNGDDVDLPAVATGLADLYVKTRQLTTR